MGRTKQTIEKEPEPMEKRPCWKDERRIAVAMRLAKVNCEHLNSVICPLCELCGLPITEERTRGYIGNMAAIEADYIASVLEQTAGVTDFLAGAIEQEAKNRFNGFVESLSGAIKRNPVKRKEGFYNFGSDEVLLEEVLETIRLKGRFFRVDTAMIQQLYTFILSDADMAKYERQKAAAKALNEFFRGGADNYLLQAAFNISGGEVSANSRINYKLIKE